MPRSKKPTAKEVKAKAAAEAADAERKAHIEAVEAEAETLTDEPAPEPKPKAKPKAKAKKYWRNPQAFPNGEVVTGECTAAHRSRWKREMYPGSDIELRLVDFDPIAKEIERRQTNRKRKLGL